MHRSCIILHFMRQRQLNALSFGLLSRTSTVKLTSRHPYNTCNNQKLLMGQLEQNQAAIREDKLNMRTQMGQLMDTLHVMVIGQEEQQQANLRAFVANIHVCILVVNQPPLEGGLMNQNVSLTLNIPVDEEEQLEVDDQNDLFFMPKVDATPDAFGPPVAEMEKKFHILEEKVKVI